MKKVINRANIHGYVYDCNLKISEVKKADSPVFGTKFITGKISVATDEECINVVDIRFGYVPPTTKNGSPNKTYDVLDQIMNGATVLKDGKENAIKVTASPSIVCNDFMNRQNELVSAKSLEGGFISIVNSVTPQAKFEADFLVTKYTHYDEDTENEKPEYGKLDGYVFLFNGAIQPVSFNVKDAGGMGYFESAVVPDQPLFLKVEGDIISKTIKVKKEEQGAWSVIVKEYDQTFREYLITQAKEAYELGDESILTQDEYKKALADRELKLAEVKKAHEERQNAPATTAPAPAAEGGFGW